MTDLTGQYLGRYYLVERLGEGGMAVVYKAYDTRLERDVAIKIIRSDAFPASILDEVLKRFEREAKSLAKLSHPSIVKVHDYGEHDGSPYLVMEYLPGGTLKKKLGKRLPWQEAVRLILPVARGIAYAHQRGILHRDIKPANVLVSESGEPMLSDFGIAKLFEADQTTALTGSGMAIGTPEYMAPEQWTGFTSPQSDLYSLGVMLYEMVAGRKPYVADTPAAILIKQATEPLPAPRKFVHDLPEELELILIKALAKEPGDRYKDIAALIGALEKLRIEALVATPLAPETKLAEKPRTMPVPETVVSVPRQAPTALGGETLPAAEPETVQGSLPAPIPVKRTLPSVKFSRKWVGLLGGGVALVLAIWLGSLLIEKWLSTATVPAETATRIVEVNTRRTQIPESFPPPAVTKFLPVATITLGITPGSTEQPVIDVQSPQTAAQAAIPVETLAPTSEPQYVRYDVPSEGFYSTGPADAPITIIEFSDYQCPFCRRWHQEVYQPLLAAYPGKIRLVYRNLPLTSIHADAFPAAEAAMCAGEQNAYWPYHEKLFASETLGTDVYKQYAQELGLDMTTFEACITDHKYQQAIQDDSDFAINLGVRSTPTFFINGLAIVGAQPLDVFKQVIDKELAGEIPQ